jgi:alpha-tubulin suppressor-like RCC1 family protein
VPAPDTRFPACRSAAPGLPARHSPAPGLPARRPPDRLAGAAVLLTAAVLIAGCSAAAPQHQPRHKPRMPGVVSTVAHWGAFFGWRTGFFDQRVRPGRLALPGPVVQVASSNSTQYALLADGSVYAWGLGTSGQLGNGRWANSFTRAVRVRFPRGVRIARLPADAMPYDTALAVDTTGHVWGWGHNGYGDLCLGNARSRAFPARLPLPGVTALAGASNHALYDARGTVYACGQNLDGDLGDGGRAGRTRPARVAGLPAAPVTTLVAAFANSGALLADGRYYDWGYDGDGQLGDGRLRKSSRIPVRVALPRPVIRVAQGGSWWGNGQTIVQLDNTSLWGWGDDRAHQLGLRSTASQPVPARFYSPAGVTYRELATGAATSYAISTAGRVYAWGASHTGQLGDGATRTSRRARLVAPAATSISATANNVVISLPGATAQPASAHVDAAHPDALTRPR